MERWNGAGCEPSHKLSALYDWSDVTEIAVTGPSAEPLPPAGLIFASSAFIVSRVVQRSKLACKPIQISSRTVPPTSATIFGAR